MIDQMSKYITDKHSWFAWRPVKLSTPDDILPGPCEIACRKGPWCWFKTIKRQGILAGSSYDGCYTWWEYSE